MLIKQVINTARSLRKCHPEGDQVCLESRYMPIVPFLHPVSLFDNKLYGHPSHKMDNEVFMRRADINTWGGFQVKGR